MSGRKLVSFDWALKRLLRSKVNFGVLEGFLSELLNDDIKILEILESEGNQDTASSKVTRVDMKVRDNKGRQIIIELRHTRQVDYLQRMLFHASKAIAEAIPRRRRYDEVARVVSVNIVYSDDCGGKDYVYIVRNVFRGMHTQDVLNLTDDQRRGLGYGAVPELFPEYFILRVDKFGDVVRDGLDQWIYFLKNEDIPGNFDARGLLEAKETLDMLKLSPQERQAYDAFEDQLHQDSSIYGETLEKLDDAPRR